MFALAELYIIKVQLCYWKPQMQQIQMMLGKPKISRIFSANNQFGFSQHTNLDPTNLLTIFKTTFYPSLPT